MLIKRYRSTYGNKKYLPTLADNMPYKDEYTQTISAEGDAKQTMVDVDMVMASGDVGEYRGGITLAENLPNSDKLSLTIGGGRRNVYHRQIRFISDRKNSKKGWMKFLIKSNTNTILMRQTTGLLLGMKTLILLDQKEVVKN